MKKNIKIKFIGFWHGFVDNDNQFYNFLAKHYDVELSDNPDYLFYSSFCPQNFDFSNYDCVRIMYSGENNSPNFDFCDYAIGFDNISYDDRFLNFPLFLSYPELNSAKTKHIDVPEDLFNNKEYFANFIVGNAQGMQLRTDMFYKLSEFKEVKSPGTYLNNCDGFNVSTLKEKSDFQNKCRFSITFESTKQKGFTTEKILHGFSSRTIPIYYGNEDISKIFNEKSFINVHNYDNLDEVIKEVIKIEENPKLWEEMIKTPCFKDEFYVDNKYEEFEEFMLNIFNQPLKEAYRRSKIFHPKRYDDDLKEYVRLKNDIVFNRFLKYKDNFFVVTLLKILNKLKIK